MEAVAADFVLLIIFHRQTVHIGFLGHGLVESGIKHGHHGRAGHQLPAGVNADQIGWIVQGRQIVAGLYGLQHLVVNNYRLGKFLAAMHHPMTYCANLFQTLHHSRSVIGQGLQHQTDGLCMIRHGSHLDFLFPACRRVDDLAAVNTDAFTQSLCQALLRPGINQLEFQRGTPAVYHQNIHVLISFLNL